MQMKMQSKENKTNNWFAWFAEIPDVLTLDLKLDQDQTFVMKHNFVFNKIIAHNENQ